MNGQQKRKSSAQSSASAKRARGVAGQPIQRPPAPQPSGETRGIVAPVAFGSVAGARRPQISSSRADGDLRVRIRHREYVTDITGSVAFAVAQYNINPGLALLFPWLSAMAGLFESYIFRNLRFQFRTESATSQVGKILMSVDWDVLDAAPVTKTAMMQERTKADGPTWVDLDLRCDQADLLKFGTQRYIRTGSAPTVSDLKTYDVGMFNIGSQGVTGAPVIGELWVEYDVELITPNTAPDPISARILSGGTVSNAAPFGDAPVKTGTLNVSASGATLTFSQVGQFMVDFYFTGTISSYTASTGTVTEQGLVAIVTNGSAGWLGVLVKVTAPGQTLILSSPTGTVTASSVRIGGYTYSLV